MAFTQTQIEELHSFRQSVAANGGAYDPSGDDNESIVFSSLRVIACEVVLHKLPPADGRNQLAEIARVFGGMDSYLDELIGSVEDSIAYVESETNELVS
jgi:hypothetical protein